MPKSAIPSPTKLIIFDYDGVIVDSLETAWQIYNEYHQRYNLPPINSKDAIRVLFDKNIFETAKGFGFSLPRIIKLSLEVKRLQLKHMDQLHPFKGMKVMIGHLVDAGFTLAIISSNDTAVVNQFLQNNSLHQHFTYVLGGNSGRSKTRKIKILLRRLKLAPDNIYYVGDTIGDIIEGHRAGVKVIAVTWGYHSHDKLAQQNPDFLADTPKQLEKLLTHET